MALAIRRDINGNHVWYNKNFHLEPSNVCTHRCRFCSYRRENDNSPGAWNMTLEQAKDYCLAKYTPDITEVHIVGSVHPSKNLNYYYDLVEYVRKALPPAVTIKAFTAVELDDMAKKGALSTEELLTQMKNRGVKILPGGGAEIFSPHIRNKICPDKADAKRWLEIHETAHKLGFRSNSTMLFGHIESKEHRIDHMLMLRDLQDKTGGFDAFIPLLYKKANNNLGITKEADITEILKTFAISRIVLDNIPHIKAYWPMLGKEISQLALLYGADDIDGTINDSTKIYSMAGSKEQKPTLTVDEIERLAGECGFNAVERDSFYNIIPKK
jgi:aminodeoxyfutalosine synthase